MSEAFISPERQREQLRTYKDLHERLHRHHWQLADLEADLRQREIELAHDPSDAQLTRQCADLRRWKSALEDRILRDLFAADELAAQLNRS